MLLIVLCPFNDLNFPVKFEEVFKKITHFSRVVTRTAMNHGGLLTYSYFKKSCQGNVRLLLLPVTIDSTFLMMAIMKVSSNTGICDVIAQ